MDTGCHLNVVTNFGLRLGFGLRLRGFGFKDRFRLELGLRKRGCRNDRFWHRCFQHHLFRNGRFIRSIEQHEQNHSDRA